MYDQLSVTDAIGAARSQHKTDSESSGDGASSRSMSPGGTGSWRNLMANPHDPIDFAKVINNLKNVPDKFVDKYGKYRFGTVGEYRSAKQYPSPAGKDFRREFDLQGAYWVAHGTNFETIIRSVLNSNFQLTPILKSTKLNGGPPSTGEKAAGGWFSGLNFSWVSAIDMKSAGILGECPFKVPREYALRSTSAFLQGDKSEFNKIPVVIIGDGVMPMGGAKFNIPGECAVKRINIRIIAFKTERDRTAGEGVLRQLPDDRINSLRTCLYRDISRRNSEEDFQDLWLKSRLVGVFDKS
ncbi:hypothetical protein [Burkholderia cenocepacia]|uniref:hypothetical protein n=1 Tax=Burkholderia cenocepacia TaxID=95486 RepID=UPI000F5B4BF1|nr:hypothetical protein [Burkholderia cenocepacia]